MKKINYLLVGIAMLCTFNACKKDKSELMSYTVTGTASSSYMNDADNKAATTFIDFTNQQAYNYATALQHQSTTDVVMRTSFYNTQPPAGSANLFMSSIKGQGAAAWGGSGNLDDFGVKNTTMLATVQGKISFEGVTDQVTLDDAFSKVPANAWGTYTSDINTASTVVAFKLQSGRKGIFRISNYNANKPFSYTMDVKMEL